MVAADNGVDIANQGAEPALTTPVIALASGGFVRIAAVTSVQLGTARTFGVLAGSGITNTGPTTITGDTGSSPTQTETGFDTVTRDGANYLDAVALQAQTDLITAYDTAAGESPATAAIAAALGGGQTLNPGIYNSGSSIQLNGMLTLDGLGNPDALFVFQAGSTLTTASASSVVLSNGAQSCNVFWQVGSSATLGTGSHFAGTILAYTSITANTGAVIDGRLLARNAAVTLDSNTITRPSCQSGPDIGPGSDGGTETGPGSGGGTDTGTGTGTDSSGGGTTGVPISTWTGTGTGTWTRTGTGTGTSTGTGTGTSTATSTALHQVAQVPAGSVHAGDGSRSGFTTVPTHRSVDASGFAAALPLIVIVLLVGGAGATAALVTRRRHAG